MHKKPCFLCNGLGAIKVRSEKAPQGGRDTEACPVCAARPIVRQEIPVRFASPLGHP